MNFISVRLLLRESKMAKFGSCANKSQTNQPENQGIKDSFY
ncbi:hypothetical protein AVEN_184206-1, partial [Araneus ventricosus]